MFGVTKHKLNLFNVDTRTMVAQSSEPHVKAFNDHWPRWIKLVTAHELVTNLAGNYLIIEKKYDVTYRYVYAYKK